jgi:hypothetical protein
MKVYGQFRVGYDDDAKLLKALLKAHPEGSCFTPAWPELRRSAKEYFRCKLLKDDPKLEKLIAILKDHGYLLWDGEAREDRPTPRDIRFKYIREYDASDLENAVLLMPMPEAYTGNVKRNEDGLLELSPDKNSMREELVPFRKFDIGFAYSMTLICSDGLRAKLEASGLKRLCFKPLLNKYNLKAGPIPGYWELTGDYILPPLANPDLFEGFYWPAEYHYRASDLKDAPEFDLALACEYKEPIVSQRFYGFCIREKLAMNTWTPVRIDAD